MKIENVTISQLRRGIPPDIIMTMDCRFIGYFFRKMFQNLELIGLKVGQIHDINKEIFVKECKKLCTKSHDLSMKTGNCLLRHISPQTPPWPTQA